MSHQGQKIFHGFAISQPLNDIQKLMHENTTQSSKEAGEQHSKTEAKSVGQFSHWQSTPLGTA